MYFSITMFLVLLSAMLIQGASPGLALLEHARFPVLLGVVLYYALNHPMWVGVTAAFLAGMLQDSMSMVPLGYSSFLFCLSALVAGHYRKQLLSDALITAAFFGALCAVVISLSLYLLLRLENLVECPVAIASLRIIFSGALGAVVVPGVFLIMKGLHHALDLEDKEEADVGA
jgi:rod shape-determining protein MreD